LHDIFSKTMLMTVTHAAHARGLFLSEIAIDLRINCQNAFSSRHVRQCHKAMHVYRDSAVNFAVLPTRTHSAFTAPPFLVAVRMLIRAERRNAKCDVRSRDMRAPCITFHAAKASGLVLSTLHALFFYLSSLQNSSYL